MMITAACCLIALLVPADQSAPTNELTGTWVLVELELPEMREDFVPAFEKDLRFTFDGRSLKIGSEDKIFPYRLNSKAKPAAIDLAGGSEYLGRDRQLLSIYEVKGDTLRLSVTPAQEGRPATFGSARLLTLRRVK
ncbi:MAG: hypothetical protein AB7K24_16615 [Gemmataceae bacterium]